MLALTSLRAATAPERAVELAAIQEQWMIRLGTGARRAQWRPSTMVKEAKDGTDKQRGRGDRLRGGNHRAAQGAQGALRGPTPVSDGPSISGFTPTTGKAGDTITISGERLQDTALVRIGAGRIEAQDLGRDRTSIKGNVPGNATSGEVIVFTPLGVAISAEEFKMT